MPVTRLPALTPRLQCVADQVRAGCRLIDVGCDHAHLCAHLVGAGHCSGALATDIRSGPCDSARSTLRRYGLEHLIEVVQTDGLQGIAFGPCDDVVIAGMGGEMVVRILQARPEVVQPGIRLVLQPQTDLPLVRAHLYQNGYRFAEHLATEGHRLYHILSAELCAGQVQPPSLFELEIGCPLGSHRQVAHYCKKLRSTLTVRLEGMRRAAAPDEQTAAAMQQIETVLALLTDKQRQQGETT